MKMKLMTYLVKSIYFHRFTIIHEESKKMISEQKNRPKGARDGLSNMTGYRAPKNGKASLLHIQFFWFNFLKHGVEKKFSHFHFQGIWEF